ncbi:PadR family transcriptional regulator [Actinoplanes sp. NPDC049668]|uniref:PadR family transcriptional regulator n=1 Tax=unclassified Actinoplanes TaxID=2626549 RepID=UPI0033BAA5E7
MSMDLDPDEPGTHVYIGPGEPGRRPPLPPEPPLPPPPPAPPGRAGLRVRKGGVRIALIGLLDEAPSNGYQLMQSIISRSGGRWRPSAGSVYPTLAQLVDEGLVTGTGEDPERRHRLTPPGRAVAAEQRSEFGGLWPAVHSPRGSGAARVREICHQLQLTAARLTDAEPPERLTRAASILEQAHHDLRRLFPSAPASGE